jgi:hypothetical protein
MPPFFFTNAPPRDYTEATWTDTLRQKLTPEEVALVVNPLTSTSEMKTRARELTVGATNDLQKARMLYDALAGRATEKPARFQEPPTARQVFAAWNVPGASFHCQEFSFLPNPHVTRPELVVGGFFGRA